MTATNTTEGELDKIPDQYFAHGEGWNGNGKEAILSWHQSQLDEAAREAKSVGISQVHEVLAAYGKACEDEGCLSDRAVRIRMDLSAYYHDVQLTKSKEDNDLLPAFDTIDLTPSQKKILDDNLLELL
ncbi:hypothetical protein [Rhodococcus sp. NPDC004095]